MVKTEIRDIVGKNKFADIYTSVQFACIAQSETPVAAGTEIDIVPAALQVGKIRGDLKRDAAVGDKNNLFAVSGFQSMQPR